MSNFQNLEVGIGSVALGDRSLSNGNNGEKKTTRHVNFDLPFSGVPKVSLSINFLDASSSEQVRFRVIAENINASGFDCLFLTWSNNTVYDMSVDYVAVYNPKSTVRNNQSQSQPQQSQTQSQSHERNYDNDNNNTSLSSNTYNNINQGNQQRGSQSQRQQNYDDDNNNEEVEGEQDYNQQQQQPQRGDQSQQQYNNHDNQQRQQPQQQSNQQSSEFVNRNLNIKSNKFNNFVRDNNGKGDMSANASTNETWTITSANNDLYYIHNKFNHYLSSSGDRVLVSERNDTSLWKITFNRQKGVYSIQNSKNGQYLSATDRSEAKTNVKVVNSWEEFTFNFTQ